MFNGVVIERGRGHEAVKLMLAKDGIDPDCKDKHSRTPLSIAVIDGRETVVGLLLGMNSVDLRVKASGS
jgi:hypothetical protein